MKDKICMFFSHNEIDSEERLYPILKEEIEYLITDENAREFWVSEKDAFDIIAAKCINELIAEYPHIPLRLVTKKNPDRETMADKADLMISYDCRLAREKEFIKYAVKQGVNNFVIYRVY